jgi:hypothetical protein
VSFLCGQPLSKLTAIPLGGTGPYTYLWSTGATPQTIWWQAPPPGNYELSVEITDTYDGTTQITGKTVMVRDDPSCPTCFEDP